MVELTSLQFGGMVFWRDLYLEGFVFRGDKQFGGISTFEGFQIIFLTI